MSLKPTRTSFHDTMKPSIDLEEAPPNSNSSLRQKVKMKSVDEKSMSSAIAKKANDGASTASSTEIPEEDNGVRSQISIVPSPWWSCPGRRVALVLLAVVLLLLVIVFPLVFKMRRRREGELSSKHTRPSQAQLYQAIRSKTLEMVPGISNYTLDTMMNPFSIQMQAYHVAAWDHHWDTYEDWRKRQRFGMACMWFAFDRTLPLLSTTHECNWTNHQQQQVTICGDKGQVLGLSWKKVFWSAPRRGWNRRFVPSEVSLVSELEFLDLSNSKFLAFSEDQGTHTEVEFLLPLDMPNVFPSLKTLKVSDCIGLQGSLPSTLGLLTSLTQLDFSTNEIGSTIPTELGLLSNLTSLYLQFNDLTGTIPVELGDLPHLTHLNIEDNGIEEFIPAGLCNEDRIPMAELTTNWCWDGSPCCD